MGGSRSYKHKQNKKIEGGKQGSNYQRGWGVGKNYNEEDDLWSCCSQSQTSNSSKKYKCQAVSQE